MIGEMKMKMAKTTSVMQVVMVILRCCQELRWW